MKSSCNLAITATNSIIIKIKNRISQLSIPLDLNLDKKALVKTGVSVEVDRELISIAYTSEKECPQGFSQLCIDDDLTLENGLTILKKRLRNLRQEDKPNLPSIIRLLERPNNILFLPTQIDLFTHDCIHILLGIGTYLYDEAFVLGFTMGNNVKINFLHKKVYKIFSHFIYPSQYQFTQEELKIFDLGFIYGRSLNSKNLHLLDFNKYLGSSIKEIRKLLNISLYDSHLNKLLDSVQLKNISYRIADTLMSETI